MDSHVKLQFPVFSRELRLLIEMMKRDNDIKKYNNHMDLLHGINWDVFLQLSTHHRVYPIVYRNLQKIGDNEVPSYVMHILKQSFEKNTFMMMYLSGEMEKISSLFSVHQIRLLVLKGPVLAFDLYGDISFRTSCDLDIMISLNELHKVEELLIKQGYEKDDYIRTILNDWKWRHHHVTYFHPQTGVKLEVHWRLNPGPGKEPSFNELWERKRISSLSSFPVFYLGSEDLFLFLVSHGARHGWSRLRWLVDIDHLTKQEINWDRVIKLLEEYQSGHLGGQALILSSNLFNTSITEKMEKIVRRKRSKQLAQDALFYIKQMINLHTEPIPDEVAKYHKHHLFSLMSIQQKLLFILSFLYPYANDADTLPLPKKFHIIYFPLRPLLWIWRKTEKVHIHRGNI